MGMHNYGVHYYGVVALATEVNLEEIQKEFGFSKQDMEDEAWRYEFMELDEGSILPRDYVSGEGLEGDFTSLLSHDYFQYISAEEDDWVLFELPKYPSLFKRRYKNEDEMIEEIKRIYGRFISNEDFDWKSRLVELKASVYC